MRNKDVGRRLHYSAEPLGDIRERESRRVDDDSCNPECMRVWDAALLGSAFRLRWGEMNAIELRDIALGGDRRNYIY